MSGVGIVFSSEEVRMPDTRCNKAEKFFGEIPCVNPAANFFATDATRLKHMGLYEGSPIARHARPSFKNRRIIK
jgi:hypothetical protein